MAKSSVIQVRVDENLKASAEALFQDLGLDVASAIRLFLRQAVIHEGIPFAITRANDFHNDYNLQVLRNSIQQLNRGEGKARSLVEVDNG